MTKAQTQASYEARLNRVTDYLCEHLDEDIRPEHLAETACLSAYHWLLGVWLPQSGHEPDDAPVFEGYLNSPQHVAPKDLLTDLHLPLKRP